VRISDLSYVAVSDNHEFAEGNMDVFFYGSGATEMKQLRMQHTNIRAKTNAAPNRLFDCRGRSVSGRCPVRQGVMIQASGQNATLHKTASAH
jgi:hypothetical protein